MDRLSRFFRKTAAKPDGTITHDGDCEYYSVRICTCGLLHTLNPISDPEVYYEKFWDELVLHTRQLQDLRMKKYEQQNDSCS